MVADLKVSRFDDVHCSIVGDISAMRELVDYFTFRVPGCEFTPKFRSRMWDGNIRLYNPNTKKVYAGLIPYLEKFAAGEWEIDYEDGILVDHGIELDKIKKLCTDLDPHSNDVPIAHRDYQLDAIHFAINKERTLLLSPTGSGKSLIIYTLIRYYEKILNDKKILIIVPTTSLVRQLHSDFGDYSSKDENWNVEDSCHMVFQGQDKIHPDKPIVISTWQSIYKLGKQYFSNFRAVIGDEAHQFKSNSLIGILEKMHDCPYRIGTTGTLDGSKTHKLVLEGLFGEVKQVTTTKKLMDNKQLATLKIKCLVLQYEPSVCKNIKNYQYRDEIEWLITCEKRNKFITNLVGGLTGNTLVLFNMVEKHGRPLFEMINSKYGENRVVDFVHGGVDSSIREQIRKDTEDRDGSIIVASYGVFSTGINLKSLKNIVFASPSKSKIRNLQSIGRVLRRTESKTSAVLYDIVDDLHHHKHKNFALKHFIERVSIYNDEKFTYKIFEIPIKL